MKKPHIKAVVSALMLLGFLYLAVSGAVLYFGKTGLVFGIPRGAVRRSHALIAAVICLVAVVHFILNRRIFIAELYALRKIMTEADKTGENSEKRK